MSFYNQYSEYPDWGGGMQDFFQQMLQMIMYKKYMDSMGQAEGQGQPGDWTAAAQVAGTGVQGVPQGQNRGMFGEARKPPVEGYTPGHLDMGGYFQNNAPGSSMMPQQFPQMPQQPQQQGGQGAQGLISMLMQNPEMLKQMFG